MLLCPFACLSVCLLDRRFDTFESNLTSFLPVPQAVNAMLAALPEHLQGLPKGQKGSVAVPGNRASRVSMGSGLSAGRGDAVSDAIPLDNDENTGRTPLLRQSARVKQNTSKAPVPRLAPIFEDIATAPSPGRRDSTAVNMIENPISRQRKSAQKSSFLSACKDKEATYVPNLLEDDEGGLQSNAWMTI